MPEPERWKPLTCDRHQAIEDSVNELKCAVAHLQDVIDALPDKMELAVLKGVKAAQPQGKVEKEIPVHQTWSTKVWLAVIFGISGIFTGFFKIIEILLNILANHAPTVANAVNHISKVSGN